MNKNEYCKNFFCDCFDGKLCKHWGGRYTLMECKKTECEHWKECHMCIYGNRCDYKWDK